jgi:general secretion pathway protein F
MRSKKALDAMQTSVLWRQLGGLLKSGLPLPQALVAVGRDSESEALQSITESLRAAVDEGESFSNALARSGEFDEATVASVRAGERAGDLPGVATLLAGRAEQTERMHARGRLALTYPILLLAGATVISVGMASWVLPAAQSFYGESRPPGPGQLFRLAYVLPVFFALIGLCGLVLVAAHRFPGAFPWMRPTLDRWLLRLPVWRDYYRATLLARFARVLSLLLRSGMPLDEALPLAGQGSGSSVVADECQRAARAVREGDRATSVWKAGAAFSPAALWSLKVAEERGDLEQTLAALADYFEESAEVGAATFLTTVEPLAIAIVGLLVLATVLSIVLPTFQFYATIY